MLRSDRELATYLDNHIPGQAEILDCLARIAQQERVYAFHQPRQPLAILTPHDGPAPNEIGYVGRIDRVAPRVRTLEQGREIGLLHEAVMSVDAPHLRGDLA